MRKQNLLLIAFLALGGCVSGGKSYVTAQPDAVQPVTSETFLKALGSLKSSKGPLPNIPQRTLTFVTDVTQLTVGQYYLLTPGDTVGFKADALCTIDSYPMLDKIKPVDERLVPIDPVIVPLDNNGQLSIGATIYNVNLTITSERTVTFMITSPKIRSLATADQKTVTEVLKSGPKCKATLQKYNSSLHDGQVIVQLTKIFFGNLTVTNKDNITGKATFLGFVNANTPVFDKEHSKTDQQIVLSFDVEK